MSSPITPMADNVVAQLEEASNQTASVVCICPTTLQKSQKQPK